MFKRLSVCILVAAVLAWPMAASAQVVVQSISTAGETVVYPFAGVPRSAVVQLSGTWTGTLTFEASVQPGTWTAVVLVRQSTSAISSTATANDTYMLSNPGYSAVRARASAWTSGTAVVAIQSGNGAPDPAIASAAGNILTRTGGTIVPTVSTDVFGTISTSGEFLAREAFLQPHIVVEQDFTAKVLTAASTMYVLGSPVGLITYREELAKTTSSWVVAANKLDITADNTTISEGVEIYLGDGLLTDASNWVQTGTTGGCFTVNFDIALIAGTAQFVIGWRNNGAFQAGNVYTGYANWSVVGINNVDGSVFSLGEVAGGGTLSDDSGVNAANGGTYTLKSCLSTTGVPTAFLNGNPITMTNSGVAKTTATGMNPFISYLAAGTTDANIRINWFEVSR